MVRIEHLARGKREGRIVKVTERKTRNITGFVSSTRNSSSSCPTTRGSRPTSSWSPARRPATCATETWPRRKVTKFPDGGDPECKLLKVFRASDDAKKISQFIAYKHGPLAEVPEESGDRGQGRRARHRRLKDRIDLRATDHVTIDGEFAKDFDDAVFVEKTKKGFLLYVSIADVSHYVKPDSALDREAYARGTSVYFPGSVIPMLPKQLSNVICSLNPNEDRMTLTARLSTTGRATSSRPPSTARSSGAPAGSPTTRWRTPS